MRTILGFLCIMLLFAVLFLPSLTAPRANGSETRVAAGETGNG